MAKQWQAEKQLLILPTLLRGNLVDYYLDLGEDEKRSLEDVKQALERKAGIKKDPIVAARYFNSRYQDDRERVMDYATQLRKAFKELTLKKMWVMLKGRPTALDKAIEEAVTVEEALRFGGADTMEVPVHAVHPKQTTTEVEQLRHMLERMSQKFESFEQQLKEMDAGRATDNNSVERERRSSEKRVSFKLQRGSSQEDGGGRRRNTCFLCGKEEKGRIRHSNVQVMGANGSPLDVMGVLSLKDVEGHAHAQRGGASEKFRKGSWLKVDLQGSELTTKEMKELRGLLEEYSELFSDGELGRTSKVKHGISTFGPPIRQPIRRQPVALRKTVQEEIHKMLKNKVIRPSTSPWSSPIIMVRKKDGSWRFCIDFRKLNSVTHKDANPLPRIDETLESLAGSTIFSTLDLASGYWQAELEENDKEKTAFSTMEGHFEFNVMPFGLTNAPSSFQQINVTNDQCLIYIDDIIVFSATFSEHLDRLRNVFQRVQDAGLRLKANKCHFAQSKVSYLGHIVSKNGVEPDPSKIQAVLHYLAPNNVKELRQFLGWTAQCTMAFQELKERLTTPPVLAFPQFDREFLLATDASDSAIGAVLSQVDDNGTEKVIAYWSRQLTKAERNYSTIEREALAIVKAVKEFYPYLYVHDFILQTDHQPLVHKNNLRDVGGRVTRWSVFLQQFPFPCGWCSRIVDLISNENRQVERFNCTVEANLTTMVGEHQDDWDKHLQKAVFAYRTSLHESTGYSPYFVNFGRSPVLPVDVMLGRFGTGERGDGTIPQYIKEVKTTLKMAYDVIRENLDVAQKKRKERRDKHCAEVNFKVGDRVWLFNPAVKVGETRKLSSQWRGPYTVIDRVSPVNYKIQLIETTKTQTVHHNRMKMSNGDPEKWNSEQSNEDDPVVLPDDASFDLGFDCGGVERSIGGYVGTC
eukprot:Em0041g27a